MKERTKKDGTKLVGISVFMKPELHQQLKAQAEAMDIPITLLIRKSARAFLDGESIMDGSQNTPLGHLSASIDHLANSVDRLKGEVESTHSKTSA